MKTFIVALVALIDPAEGASYWHVTAASTTGTLTAHAICTKLG